MQLGKQTCTAHNRSGQPCSRPAVHGKRVCYYHGGAPGSGRPVVHGRYSKALKQTALSAAYAEAVNDQSLLDLREPIALLEAALQRTAERVAEFDTPSFRVSALELLEDMQQALASKDRELAASKMSDLRLLLQNGVQEDQAIKQMVDQADRLSKRVEAAWGLKLQRQQVLNVQQLGVVMGRVLEIVTQESTPQVAAVIVRRMESEVLQLPSQKPDDDS